MPQYDERTLDVLAFELPDGVDQAAANQVLITCLADVGEYTGVSGAASDLRNAIGPVLQALDNHRGMASQESAAS
ncbi:hypothetical protein ET475_02450 [Microbacterium protaetiae]|uniref:Uncharacterized protein n=1 Tax=Microbacterium protaetiae TaxID=2509458 RepID=A0A4P6EMA9_9MICO|nr:hypothetical protein ET475_02450 [Microbacterium protaetiae]